VSQEQLEANKALVREFFQRVFIDHKVDFGLELMHDNYIQHNQMVPGGKEAMRAAFAKGLDNVSTEIKQVIAEGDRVAVQHHFKFDPASPGMIVIDIFRVENGKLAEHWDVMTPVPENPPFPKPLF
jgi:predicted SnoaL-like aldol condensation-catalyzing enzyme